LGTGWIFFHLGNQMNGVREPTIKPSHIAVTSTLPSTPIVPSPTLLPTPIILSPTLKKTSPPSSPTPILSPTPMFSPYADGTLLKGSGAEIYVIVGGARFHIPNIAIFVEMGYSSDQVKLISDGTLVAIPLIPREKTLLKEKSSPAIYLVSQGMKLHIPDMEIFTAMGCRNKTVSTLWDGSLGQVPSGSGPMPSSC
jgi:hypothetical protein